MQEFLYPFSWRDAIDIAVVAFIFYRLILLVKGRGAVRLFLVLSATVLLVTLSRFAGLGTLNWILDTTLNSLVLILVIIFQGDLRRSLVMPAKSRKATGYDREEASEVMDELVNAMTSLSERKIGALIIIERDMEVMNHLQVGTEIDAKVTSEILSSIFIPYSPIHDGAVIIQKGKLTKAGCFLPLSQNPNISKSLGTRHRAALGLTEVVDAIALVVSEETGMMSVVSGGRIVPVIDAAALRKALKRSLDSRWLS